MFAKAIWSYIFLCIFSLSTLTDHVCLYPNALKLLFEIQKKRVEDQKAQ